MVKPLIDLLALGQARVWPPTEENPDSVVISWEYENVGQVRLRMDVQQAAELAEQLDSAVMEVIDNEVKEVRSELGKHEQDAG